MRGQRALLALVVAMGVLILAGTATLVGVVVHRLAAAHSAAAVARTGPIPEPDEGRDEEQDGGRGMARAVAAEPAGTRIVAIARQSDSLLSVSLSGGGPDRVLVWDLLSGRTVAELRLAP